ncbi:hypothetical protein BXO91_22990 [Rhodococcus qingshengii]|nr:hypothetical protein BXO91_22990 [Rhodococcus qingshengii]
MVDVDAAVDAAGAADVTDELCVEEPLLELHPATARVHMAAPTVIIFLTRASNQTNRTRGIGCLNVSASIANPTTMRPDYVLRT